MEFEVAYLDVGFFCNHLSWVTEYDGVCFKGHHSPDLVLLIDLKTTLVGQ